MELRRTWEIPDKRGGYMTVSEHPEGVYIQVGTDQQNFSVVVLTKEAFLALADLCYTINFPDETEVP